MLGEVISFLHGLPIITHHPMLCSPSEGEPSLSPPRTVDQGTSQRVSSPSQEKSVCPRMEDSTFSPDHGSNSTSCLLTPEDMDASAILCDELLSEDSDADSFEPQQDDEDALLQDFVKEWLGTMQRDNLMPLSLLLRVVLVSNFKFALTATAEMIGGLLGKSGRTIREWWSQFKANDDVFPDTLQGKYSRRGVLWQNEYIDKHAVKFVRKNLAPK